MSQINFNANEVDTSDDFEIIPPGEYSAQIIQSEMKDASTGGQYLELRVQILDEPYTGRLVFERLNLVNSNPIAVKLANKSLAQLCQALNLEEVEDSEELHGQEFKVKLGTRPAKDDYPEQNVVKKYMSAE